LKIGDAVISVLLFPGKGKKTKEEEQKIMTEYHVCSS
jgi:hypothetical protein